MLCLLIDSLYSPFQKLQRPVLHSVSCLVVSKLLLRKRLMCQAAAVCSSAVVDKATPMSSLVLFQPFYNFDKFLMSFFTQLHSHFFFQFKLIK